MILRQMVLSGLCAVLLGGAASAKAPGTNGPLSEGRELDPVARDNYAPIPTSDPARTNAPAGSEEKRRDTFAAVIDAITETLLQQLTIPLGTVSPDPRK